MSKSTNDLKLRCGFCSGGIIAKLLFATDTAELWNSECANPMCRGHYKTGGGSRSEAILEYAVKSLEKAKGKAAA
jgi:hypothetical protein